MVVVCGSFSNPEELQETITRLESEGQTVTYPTAAHLAASQPCIDAHHGAGDETDYVTSLRAGLMETFYAAIAADPDGIYVYNVKNGGEHVGVSAAMEIGFAFALNKPVRFEVEPTDPGVKSMKKLIKVNTAKWVNMAKINELADRVIETVNAVEHSAHGEVE